MKTNIIFSSWKFLKEKVVFLFQLGLAVAAICFGIYSILYFLSFFFPAFLYFPPQDVSAIFFIFLALFFFSSPKGRREKAEEYFFRKKKIITAFFSFFLKTSYSIAFVVSTLFLLHFVSQYFPQYFFASFLQLPSYLLQFLEYTAPIVQVIIAPVDFLIRFLGIFLPYIFVVLFALIPVHILLKKSSKSFLGLLIYGVFFFFLFFLVKKHLIFPEKAYTKIAEYLYSFFMNIPAFYYGFRFFTLTSFDQFLQEKKYLILLEYLGKKNVILKL
jgi:hypothetical protein